MPALNITFTDEELALLRKRAAGEGRSMVAIAHDAVVTSTSDEAHRARVADAAARVIGLSEALLKRLAER